MARLYPHQLLVLCSLLSSSSHFLMRSAHVQDKHTSFRSRHVKPRDKGDADPFGVYRRTSGDADITRGVSDMARVIDMSRECQNDCGAFLSNPPDSPFEWESSELPANTGRSVASPGFTYHAGRHSKHYDRPGESHDIPEEWLTLPNGDAFAYPTNEPFDSFSKRPTGTDLGKFQLENFRTADDTDAKRTSLSEGFSDRNLGSPTENNRIWRSTVHADNAVHSSPQRDAENAAERRGGPAIELEPVHKRFRAPVHKKVFVYGHDDRLRVFLPQMRKFPFSNIARLSTGCTGTLVTPRHVLTAAHCVHNGLGFRANLEKLKIEIPDTMGFKDYYAHKITIPTGWLRENRSRRGRQSGKRAVYDYAVVRLKLAVTGRSKFLPLAVPRPEVLQMDFHFLAFPEDDQQLWRSLCLASQHMALGDGNLILTRCDAAVGNSGAAVFIRDPQEGLRVVGVLSNTMHVSHHRSFLRYSIITALTWPKLTDICSELGTLGRKYNVCPPARYMRRSHYLPANLQVIPFFGKRSQSPSQSRSPGLSQSQGLRWSRGLSQSRSQSSGYSQSQGLRWSRGLSQSQTQKRGLGLSQRGTRSPSGSESVLASSSRTDVLL